MKKNFWIKKIIAIIVFGALAVLLFGFIVMSLWNAILPAVLHVSVITFTQALGILVLSKILFGGFHGGFRGRRGGRWSNEMKDKWHSMNPEDREKWKQEMRNRCRTWGRGSNEEKINREGAEAQRNNE
ncbi:MAG: hypothetical protein ABJA78_10745 [Ferruginibacter sp.]